MRIGDVVMVYDTGPHNQQEATVLQKTESAGGLFIASINYYGEVYLVKGYGVHQHKDGSYRVEILESVKNIKDAINILDRTA